MVLRDYDDYEFPERIKGMTFVGDLESNGLLFEKKEMKAGELVISKPADKIWMICHKSPSTGECWDFIEDKELKKHGRAIARYNRRKGRKVTVLPLSLAPKFYDHCGEQYFHFGMRFDYMLMEKVMGYYLPREKRKDTLIISKTLDCDRDYVEGSTSGPHSVESYAIRFGKRPKVSHEDWLNFSVDMYERCEVDVEIQLEIKQFLEMEILSDKLENNIDWTDAIDLEHRVGFWVAWSETVGFPCDKEFAESLIVKFDKVCEEIEDELLPNMPFRCQTSIGGIGALTNWEEYAESMIKNTNLTDIPIGWCWPEEGRNRQLPVWEPFTIAGDYKSTVTTFFHGKPAQPAKPAEPERFHVPTIKAVKEKRDKEGNIIREAVEGVPGVRARKAREAVEAKPEVLSCYHDDAGLTSKSVITFSATDVWGPFTRIRWNNYNLGSDVQVKEYLVKFTDWKPLEFTDKGNPKLTEDSYESIGTKGVGEQLKTYLITKSRRTGIKNFKDDSKGWLNLLREDGRITPGNDPMGTPTARSRHSGLVNVPSGGALWGAEMRTCWTAYAGGTMFGIDSAGLEMRGLANEMGDEATTKEIIDGDIHTVLYNLVSDFTSSRGVNKGTTYGLILAHVKFVEFGEHLNT